jgi:hypothetical protein
MPDKLTPLQQKIVNALKGAAMRNSELQKAVEYPKNSGSFHHVLQRMESGGYIHKDKSRGKWSVGPAPGWTPAKPWGDEPNNALEIIEIAPGHRMIKFGMGRKAGKGQTARIGVCQSPIAGLF